MSEILKLAKNAKAEKKYEEAIRLLSEILDKSDVSDESACTKPSIYIERADVFQKMNKFERCIADAKEVLKLDSKSLEAYFLLVNSYTRLKLYGNAEVEAKKGLKIDEKNKTLLSTLRELQSDEKRHPPVRGLDGSDRKIRSLQNRSGETLDVRFSPDIVKGIMVGDIQAVRRLWCPEHLKERITPMENPPIHMVVLGRQRMRTLSDEKRAVKDYCDVIDFLFDQGERLDHCDKVGYTALMHAAGHAAEPQLLKHLLKKGADPNVKSIYGSVALTDACMAQNEQIVDTLLEHGADPYIKDNDGMTILQFAQRFKKLLAIFDKHLNPENRYSRSCIVCAGKTNINRCSGCRFFFYCSKECQREHWSVHKKECQLIKKSHLRLKVLPDDDKLGQRALISNMEEMILNNVVNARTSKSAKSAKITPYKAKTFGEFEKSWRKCGNILKIQLDRDEPDTGRMLVYNKKKDLVFFISPTELDGPQIVEVIKEKGVKIQEGIFQGSKIKGMTSTQGLKGYFYAFVEKPDEVVAISHSLVAAQPW